MYSLGKRPGFPNWYIVWSEKGRSRRRSTGTKDREEASLILAAFVLEINRREGAEADETGIASVLQDYLDQHASKLPSAEQAQIAVNHLVRFYGSSKVSTIGPQSHERYIAERRKTGVGNETISRELSVLQAALRRAVKHGWLANAPYVPSLPKAPARERVLTRQEAAKLLRQCEPYLALFVRLALYTGARPRAILDLTWDRVDFDHSLIIYPLPHRSETNKRRVVVPFEGALRTALEHAKTRARTRHVIEYEGQPVKSVRRSFRTAVKNAGLVGVTPYTLRHTTATWAVQAGVEMFAVGRLLGHSKLSTTERYAKHSPGYLKEVTRAVARAKHAPKRNL